MLVIPKIFKSQFDEPEYNFIFKIMPVSDNFLLIPKGTVGAKTLSIK
jgi:hypothetical protein